MVKKNQARIKALRAIIVITFFALLLLLILAVLKKILPGFVDILRHGDQAEIEAYIRGFGSLKGAVLGFMLQFMQIVSVVFPGAPIQLAMGIVFGTWRGFAVCAAGYVAANMVVFLLARRLGSEIDRLLPVERKPGRMRFITESDMPGFMVFLACLIPVLPNGIVPHIAAKTRLRFGQFFMAVLFGCVPCLLLLCAAGNRLLRGEYLWAGFLGGALVLAIVLLYVFRVQIVRLALRAKRRFLSGSRGDEHTERDP